MDQDSIAMTVSTDEGPVRAVVSRSALSRLSGRSHATPEEVASAYRIELEDIVRDKVRRAGSSGPVRITEADL